MRWLALLALLSSGGAATAQADRQDRVQTSRIESLESFDRFSSPVGGERVVKFLIVRNSGKLVFINGKVFRMHVDFVFQVLRHQARKPSRKAKARFARNYLPDKPDFVLGYLSYLPAQKRMVFGFWEGDAIRGVDVKKTVKTLRKALFDIDLRFRPLSAYQTQVAKRAGVPWISSDELFKSSPYHCFNPGRATGTLRVLPKGVDPDDVSFSPQEIVVLQETLLDIRPVAGIISVTFSTPLAHVNLRAGAWGIPNVRLQDAVARSKRLAGKLVVLDARRDAVTLRLATPAESRAYVARRAAERKVELPRADLDRTELVPLRRLRPKDAGAYGAKAATLGLVAARARRDLFQVPAGVGVPIRAYADFMAHQGLGKLVDSILSDPKVAADTAHRRARLAELRRRIRTEALLPAFADSLWKVVSRRFRNKGLFVRSSTNCEDLANFNGAGLYDTVPNVRGRKALMDAVRTVWASLWNLGAFDERVFYGVDHRAAYPAVLVQVGVDADAAGVLVTRNLYDARDRTTYTINAKRGLGIRVVEGKRLPEQVLYDLADRGMTIITRSDETSMLVFDGTGGVREVTIRPGRPVLTPRTARGVSRAARHVARTLGLDQALDIEWLAKGDKVYIVQARPYIGLTADVP